MPLCTVAEYLRVTRPVVGHCHRLTGPPALAVTVDLATDVEDDLVSGTGFALLADDAGGAAGFTGYVFAAGVDDREGVEAVGVFSFRRSFCPGKIV